MPARPPDQDTIDHPTKVQCVIVTFAAEMGGAERSLAELLELLPLYGIAVSVLCPAGRLSDELQRRGVVVVEQSLVGARSVRRTQSRTSGYSGLAAIRWALATIHDARAIRRLCTEQHPDVVHSNSFPSHLATTIAGLLSGTAVTWHQREIIRSGPGLALLRLAAVATRGIIAISQAVAVTLPGQRTSVVYNPVQPPPPKVQSITRPTSGPLVGFLGRLVPMKGLEDLLVAMNAVAADLLVVGEADDDNYRRHLERLAEQHAAGRVHFLGSVDDPWSALTAIDVLVVPSLAEPFGRVAAEGQRAGLAVVVADAGGLPEIVTDGVDGLLFRVKDPANLASRVQALFDDPALLKRMGEAAIVSSSRFDPHIHASQVATLLAGAAQSRPWACSRH